MKKTLLSLTAVAAVLSASAALADGQHLFVEQIGDGHHAEMTQTGLFNYSYIFQNGNGEQAFASQVGQNNVLNIQQGYLNTAHNQTPPKEYETSTAGNLASAIQVGDSNNATLVSIGLTNSLYSYQVGNSNDINAVINENLSLTSVSQNGYLNSVITHQGI